MPLLVDLYQRYNRVTDWAALTKAAAGAYIKYSDGLAGAFTPADEYVARSREHGFPYGGYHFAEPGSATTQADVFLAQYQRHGGQLAPALDLESGGIPVAQRPSFARTFLERLHERYPIAVLYASSSWLATLQPDTWPFEWDRTWCAHYGNNDGTRHAVTTQYRGRVDLHQFTSQGRIAGVDGDVDLSFTDNVGALRLESVVAAASGEEDDMTPPPYLLDAGTNQSISFRIPAWARYITINCPYDKIVVHSVVQATDKIPPITPSDPAPFSFVREDKHDGVLRLRPWLVPVGPGANHGSITYTYSPDHPERKADLSFAP